MSFTHDRRGQSVVVGTVILFGFLIVALASYQAFAVPAQNNAAEFEHNQDLQSDMQDLRASLLDVRDARQGAYQRPVRISIGFRYDSRLFAVNPPSPEGALTTQDRGPVEIRNAEAGPGFTGTSALFEPHDTELLTYRPSYNEYQNPPRTTFEHSLLYNRFDGVSQPVTGQRTVDGDDRQLSLIVYDGNVNAQGLRTTLDPETLDGATPAVPIRGENEDRFEVQLPTHSRQVWENEIGDSMDTGEPGARVLPEEEAGDSSTVIVELEGEWDLQMARVGYDGGVRDDVFSSVEEVETGEPRETTFDVRWVDPVGSSGTVSLPPGEQQGTVEVTSSETGDPVEGAQVDLSTTNRNVFGTTASPPSDSEPEDTEETLQEMDGDGSESDPYQITNDQELQSMEADLNANYELANDIDISESDNWNGGDGFDPVDGFEGSLNGNEFEVSGLFIDRDDDFVGMFGELKGGASITDVGVVDAEITGAESDAVGILAGRLDDELDVERAYTTGSVQGGDQVGGLVGRTSGGQISESFSTADVIGSGSEVGGLIGRQSSGDALTTDSYALGDVDGTGADDVGGLVGRDSSGTIERSFAANDVTDGDGLIADANDVTDSYWDTVVGPGQSDAGEGLLTDDMQGDAAAEEGNMDGFDFDDVWRTVDDDYPELRNIENQPARSLAAGAGSAGPLFADGASIRLGPQRTLQQSSVDDFLPDGMTDENGRHEFTFSITDDEEFVGETAEILASAGDDADRITVEVDSSSDETGLTDASVSDIPDQNNREQTFTAALEDDMAEGEIITIDLSDPDSGGVDYSGATVDTVSEGSAEFTADDELTLTATDGIVGGTAVTIDVSGVDGRSTDRGDQFEVAFERSDANTALIRQFEIIQPGGPPGGGPPGGGG